MALKTGVILGHISIAVRAHCQRPGNVFGRQATENRYVVAQDPGLALLAVTGLFNGLSRRPQLRTAAMHWGCESAHP